MTGLFSYEERHAWTVPKDCMKTGEIWQIALFKTEKICYIN